MMTSPQKSLPFNLPFIKMHGLGNDFVVIDERKFSVDSSPVQSSLLKRTSELEMTPELARAIGHRRFGVGFDQLLWLKAPEGEADVRMEIWNPDGGRAEMCGNGIRAAALYLQNELLRSGESPKNLYRVETVVGVKPVQVEGENFIVDMGPPQIGEQTFPEGEKLDFSKLSQASVSELGVSKAVEASLDLPGEGLRFFEVGMGNPHAIFFGMDLKDDRLEKWGRQLNITLAFQIGRMSNL
jgi:diaminopimelate epimerase